MDGRWSNKTKYFQGKYLQRVDNFNDFSRHGVDPSIFCSCRHVRRKFGDFLRLLVCNEPTSLKILVGVGLLPASTGIKPVSAISSQRGQIQHTLKPQNSLDQGWGAGAGCFLPLGAGCGSGSGSGRIRNVLPGSGSGIIIPDPDPTNMITNF